MKTLVWYRSKDLRVHDHAPLVEAANSGETIPVFVLDERHERCVAEYPHHVQFLLDALRSLSENLEKRGSRLVLVQGDPERRIPELAEQLGAERVVGHAAAEPAARERDDAVERALRCELVLHGGETLVPPGTLRTQGGTPYGVFTPFSRAFRQQLHVDDLLAAPRKLPAVKRDLGVAEVALPRCEDLGVEPKDGVLMGSEEAARKRLNRFLEDAASRYHEHRDRMDLAGTSQLSADLKFGTLSARTVWRAVLDRVSEGKARDTYLNELIWREFNYSTLWDRPELMEQPFREGFADFPWQENGALWQAWVEGKTGYPVVDASARQLLQTGFVHNRARMISASFLTKHLLISYKAGEAHYMKYLTDGDPAQNVAGWQWSAGCGCDAQPYFRVFNPMTQGEKFDPEGDYVRRYVPELAALPTKYIHSPWTAPTKVLKDAGISLGETYPEPIVDHRLGRERFLDMARQHLK